MWKPRILLPLAACFGKPLRVDDHTASGERGEFARVCVELNLNLLQPLRPRIWMDRGEASYYQKVKYENLPTVCYRCGHIGHATSACSAGKASISSTPAPQSLNSVSEQVAPSVIPQSVEPLNPIYENYEGDMLGP